MNDAQTSYMAESNAETYVGKLTTNDPVPEYYVKKLSELIHGSKRNITADNWFEFVPLALKMKDYSLTIIGTIRKNKPKIPPSFTRCASAMTSRFAFSNNITLISYCPKKNKVVLMISTLHKNNKITILINMSCVMSIVIVNVNLFEHRTLTRIYFCTLRMA